MTERVVYELEGKKFYATPVSKAKADELGLQYCDPNEPCS